MDKRTELQRCARELFSERGFKDTNVSDITKMAGFATGTFYNYYPSKEALFMEIYNEQNALLKRNILQAVDPDGDPMSVIGELLARNLKGMSEDPILKEWYNREVFMKIEKNFREQNGLEHVDFLYGSFIDIVQRWQEQGRMRRDLNSRMIMAIFAALICVETHKDEIGFEYFPELMDYLTAFTMKGG